MKVTTPTTGICEHCGQPRPLFPYVHGLSLRTACLCPRDWSAATVTREQITADLDREQAVAA